MATCYSRGAGRGRRHERGRRVWWRAGRPDRRWEAPGGGAPRSCVLSCVCCCRSSASSRFEVLRRDEVLDAVAQAVDRLLLPAIATRATPRRRGHVRASSNRGGSGPEGRRPTSMMTTGNSIVDGHWLVRTESNDSLRCFSAIVRLIGAAPHLEAYRRSRGSMLCSRAAHGRRRGRRRYIGHVIRAPC